MRSKNKNVRIQHEVFALGTLQQRHQEVRLACYRSSTTGQNSQETCFIQGYVNPWSDLAG